MECHGMWCGIWRIVLPSFFRVEEYPHCKTGAAGSSKTFATTYQDLKSLLLKVRNFTAITMTEFCHKIYTNEADSTYEEEFTADGLILNVYMFYQEIVMTFKLSTKPQNSQFRQSPAQYMNLYY
jgi:hypothetical protein